MKKTYAVPVVVAVMLLLIGASRVPGKVSLSASAHHHTKKPDRVGTISGQQNAEAIPDDTAYLLFLRTIATMQAPGKERTLSSYLTHIGLPPNDPDARARVIQWSQSFSFQIQPLDNEVVKIKNSVKLLGRGAREPVSEARCRELELRKRAIVASRIADMQAALGPDTATRVANFIRMRVKPMTKLYPKTVE